MSKYVVRLVHSLTLLEFEADHVYVDGMGTLIASVNDETAEQKVKNIRAYSHGFWSEFQRIGS